MKLGADELRQIVAATLEHYNRHAEDFRDGTQHHDVSQNIDALLRHLQGEGPFNILDLGCGPGRDLKEFTRRGHRAVGLEGSTRFVKMARADSGCEVWHQDFLNLSLPPRVFDGVYANASLFHVPSQELSRVLAQLNSCLKANGVLFSSNPRGNNQEGWSGGRYGVFYDLKSWSLLMSATGFEKLEHYFRPTGLAHSAQPWLASVWRQVSRDEPDLGHKTAE